MSEPPWTLITAAGDPFASLFRRAVERRLRERGPRTPRAVALLTPYSVTDAAFHQEVQAAQRAAELRHGAPVSFVSRQVPVAIARGLCSAPVWAVTGETVEEAALVALSAFGLDEEGASGVNPDHGSSLTWAPSSSPLPRSTATGGGSPAEPRPTPAPIDHTFLADRFEVQERLGQGASAVVHAAWDRRSGERVALKITTEPDSTLVRRFQEEFNRVADARLVHPHLVALHELLYREPYMVIVMQEVPGATDFLRWVRGGGSGRSPTPSPPDGPRLRSALLQLVEGVEALHAAGIVHLDLKPQNVLVDRDGRVKVVDFGLARETARLKAARGFAGGTLQYMPLEQLTTGPLGPPADWYAVGVMLFEALTDRLPAAGASVAELRDARESRLLVAPSTLVPETDPALDRLCTRLLAPDPTARATAATVRAALGARPRPAAPEVAPFVGRGREQQVLDEALERVTEADGPGVAWVVGASGIGKSALLRAVTGRWAADGRALVIDGRCREREHVPFRGFDRVVAGLVEAARSGSTRLPQFAAHIAPMARLLPSVASLLPTSELYGAPPPDPAETRRRAFDGLRRLVVDLASPRPVVLVVDDLQWADLDGVQLAAAMLAPPAAPRVLLVGAMRPPDRGAPDFLRELGARLDLGALPGGERTVSLGPLDPGAAARLAAECLRGAPAARVDAVVREAEGHPFLIEELARAVRDGGEETVTQDPYEVRLPQLLARRLRALEPGARELLEVVTVANWPIRKQDALEALPMGAGRLSALLLLEARNILRVTGVDPDSRLDVYHDRIREVVSADLPAERRRDLSRRLLEVARDDVALRAAQRVVLLADAGDRAAAADAALIGARAAEAGLAFAEAARLYALARGLADAADAPRWWEQEAQAWSNAGHPERAAEAWLQAAQLQRGVRSYEARVRAVEHLLSGGHVDRGTVELRPLLAESGLRWPGPRTAMLDILGRLLWLAIRGTRFRVRPAESVAPAMRARIDLCASVGQGLAVVDLARAGAFTLQGLLLALRAGEPYRVCRALAMVAAAILAPGGGVLARWGDRLIGEAEALAASLSDDYLTGLTRVCRGQAQLLGGRWRDALASFESGEEVLRDRCVGATWALDVSRMGMLRALEELGRLGEVGDTAERTIAEAEGTGNVYQQVTALLYAAYARLGAGDVEGARGRTRAAMALWSREGVHLQHLYAMRVEATCDLYERRPDAASARVEALWEPLRRAGFFRAPIARIDGHLLRGRVGLALAAAFPEARAARLAAVEADVTALAAEARADSRAGAELLRAGIAAIEGRLDEARAGYRRAREAYASVGMRAAVAGCSVRLAELEADTAGREAALAELRSCGVRQAERWVRVHAPPGS